MFLTLETFYGAASDIRIKSGESSAAHYGDRHDGYNLNGTYTGVGAYSHDICRSSSRHLLQAHCVSGHGNTVGKVATQSVFTPRNRLFVKCDFVERDEKMQRTLKVELP